MPMSIYFITRHTGALAWAKQKHLQYDVHLEHLSDLSLLKTGDLVIGTLPINIVYELNVQGVRYIHLSLQIPAELRGVELNAQQLEEYQVQRKPFFPNQE